MHRTKVSPYKSNITWKDKDINAFIESYRKNEILWNYTLPEYKDSHKREMALENMRRDLGIAGLTKENIRRKIKNIRSTYHVERQKIIKSLKNETDSIYIPRSSWYAHADSFLRKGIESREIHFSTPITGDSQDSADGLEVSDAACPSTSTATPDPNQTKISDDKMMRFIQQAITELTKVSESWKNDDEFDVFGNSVGAQLRGMPLSAALKAQEEIQSVISRHRLVLLKESTKTDLIKPSSSKTVKKPTASQNAEIQTHENPIEEEKIKVEVWDDIEVHEDALPLTFITNIKEEPDEPTESNKPKPSKRKHAA